MCELIRRHVNLSWNTRMNDGKQTSALLKVAGQDLGPNQDSSFLKGTILQELQDAFILFLNDLCKYYFKTYLACFWRKHLLWYTVL